MELFDRDLLTSFYEGRCRFLPSYIHYRKSEAIIHLGEATIIFDKSKVYYIDQHQRVNIRLQLPVFPEDSPVTLEVNSEILATLRYQDIKVTVARSNKEIQGRARVVVNDTYIFLTQGTTRLKIGETYYSELNNGERIISVRRDKINFVGHRTVDNKITFTMYGKKIAEDTNCVEVDHITYLIRSGSCKRQMVYRAVTTDYTVEFPPRLTFSRDEFTSMVNTLNGLSTLLRTLRRTFFDLSPASSPLPPSRPPRYKRRYGVCAPIRERLDKLQYKARKSRLASSSEEEDDDEEVEALPPDLPLPAGSSTITRLHQEYHTLLPHLSTLPSEVQDLIHHQHQALLALTGDTDSP